MPNSESELYHHVQDYGYWTGKRAMMRDIAVDERKLLERVVPLSIEEYNGTLVMNVSTLDGPIKIEVGKIPGLRVVQGDSATHPHEIDGELLIEINYFKMNAMEDKPRRIRPSRILFGIMGDTERASALKGGHRAIGESADYYLEGYDTQYDPGESGNNGLRSFPFWRLGIWGPAQASATEFLPEPPPNV